MNCFFCGKKLYYNPSIQADTSGDITCSIFDGRYGTFSDKVYYITLVCLSNPKKLVRINPGEKLMKEMDFSLFPSTRIFVNILKRLIDLGTKFEGVKIV